MKEFNLSEKIQWQWVIGVEDVKEFIRRLKKNLKHYGKDKQYREKIDKLAGEYLK